MTYVKDMEKRSKEEKIMTCEVDLKKWVEGQGYSYTTTVESKKISDIREADLTGMAGWLSEYAADLDDGEDFEVVVTVYNDNGDEVNTDKAWLKELIGAQLFEK